MTATVDFPELLDVTENDMIFFPSGSVASMTPELFSLVNCEPHRYGVYPMIFGWLRSTLCLSELKMQVGF